MPEHTATRMGSRQGEPNVSIVVDGKPLAARAGEMLAAALMAGGIVSLRRSPNAGTPRGAFCLMGVCQECLVRVDGKVRQACLAIVTDGMIVDFVPRVAGMSTE